MEALVVTALYDFDADSQDKLSFKAGDLIQVLQSTESGWWDGICGGRRGWFPSNYVTQPQKATLSLTLAMGWQKQEVNTDESNPYEPRRVYYHNELTGETAFEEEDFAVTNQIQSPLSPDSPSNAFPSEERVNGEDSNIDDLPPHWGRRTTLNGRTYFFNDLTNETRWTLDSVDWNTGHLRHSDNSNVDALSPKLDVDLQELPENEQDCSWDYSRKRIFAGINILKQSVVAEGPKSDYVGQVTDIVQSVYRMLTLSDTLDPASLHFCSNKMLKMHHRHILKAIGKLALSAKKASGVWPPPDAVSVMCSDANEVLLAVRHFTNVAEESGVPFSCEEGLSSPSDTIYPHDNRASQINQQRPLSTHGFASSVDEFSEALSRTISSLCAHSCPNDPNCSELISLTRTCVGDVGQFLSFVEDIPSHSLQGKGALLSFTKDRQSLYDNISGLVAATTSTSDVLAPAKVMEDVRKSANEVIDAVKRLILSSKHVLAELDLADEGYIQEELDQMDDRLRRQSDSSDVSLRPRRALSMTLSKQNAEWRRSASLKSSCAQPSESFKARAKAVEDALIPGALTHKRLLRMSTNRLSRLSLLSPPDLPSPMTALSTSLPSSRHLNMRSPEMNRLSRVFNAERPSIFDGKEWFLANDTSKKDSLFSIEGHFKGGTLPALVERLTSHDSYDADFMSAFLLTYRTFADSDTVLDLLIKRFYIKKPDGLTEDQEQMWREKKLKPIRLRVVNVFKSWLDSYFFSEDYLVLDNIKSFLKDGIREHMPSAADQLLKMIDKRISSGCASFRKGLRQSGSDPVISASPRYKNQQNLKFMDITSLDLAKQLTIFESRLFCSIETFEFLNKTWSQKNEEGAPNIRKMIQTANEITSWVADTILSENDMKKRCLVLKHFVSMAEKCRQHNNFNTAMAILAGLNSSPIHRLKRTKDLLPSRTKTLLEELKGLMDPGQNFSSYRNRLRSIDPPCVPFLGLYLTDLTFIEDGNSDFIKSHPHLINFDKRMKTTEKIREIQQFQQVSYSLEVLEDIQSFIFNSIAASERDPEVLYQKSLIIEPRERDDEKMARLLHESGFI